MKLTRFGLRPRHALGILFAATFLLGGATCPSREDARYALTILHTNDTHGRWESFSVGLEPPEAGVARRAAAISKLRTQSGNVLLVDAGDIAQGTLFNKYYRGSEARDIYNALNYDVVTLGNHEFDYGLKSLAEQFLTGAKFDTVLANVDFESAPELKGKIQPYVVKRVGLHQVGVIGVITDQFANLSPLGNTIKISPITDTVRNAIAELKVRNVNRIVVLSHQGYEADIALAKAVAGIDIIVGGDSETLLGERADFPVWAGTPSGPYPTVVTDHSTGPTLIVHALNWGRVLGRLSVNFNRDGVLTDWTGRGLYLSSNMPEDAAVKALVRKLKEPLVRYGDTVIGQAANLIDGYRVHVRNQESPMGNLVTNALLWSVRQNKAQIALQQGGGIRDSFSAGSISLENIFTVVPFDNYVVEINVPGKTVREALEHGLSQMDLQDPADSGGGFPHVAGMRYTADLRKPVGARLEKVEVKNASGKFEPLQLDKNYRMVSNNFLLGGGDGYTMFAEYTDRVNHENTIGDALTEYVKAHSPVSAAVEGRIVLIR